MRQIVLNALPLLINEHPEFDSVGTVHGGVYVRFVMNEHLKVELGVLVHMNKEDFTPDDFASLHTGMVYIVHSYNGHLNVMIEKDDKKTRAYWKKITNLRAVRSSLGRNTWL